MYSRARKLDNNGFLQPFVSFDYFGDPKKLNLIEIVKAMHILLICHIQLPDQKHWMI